MLSYASARGHAFIDRALYLPRRWTDDPQRCAQAGVPAERGFLTKPQLVIDMLDRALAAGVPFRYFTADSGYGRDPGLRARCHAAALSTAATGRHFCPTANQKGLLEPVAWKAGTAGSEGAPAQQCAGATRPTRAAGGGARCGRS